MRLLLTIESPPIPFKKLILFYYRRNYESFKKKTRIFFNCSHIVNTCILYCIFNATHGNTNRVEPNLSSYVTVQKYKINMLQLNCTFSCKSHWSYTASFWQWMVSGTHLTRMKHPRRRKVGFDLPPIHQPSSAYRITRSDRHSIFVLLTFQVFERFQ